MRWTQIELIVALILQTFFNVCVCIWMFAFLCDVNLTPHINFIYFFPRLLLFGCRFFWRRDKSKNTKPKMKIDVLKCCYFKVYLVCCIHLPFSLLNTPVHSLSIYLSTYLIRLVLTSSPHSDTQNCCNRCAGLTPHAEKKREKKLETVNCYIDLV